MRPIKFRAICIDDCEFKGKWIYGFGVFNWEDDDVTKAELYSTNGNYLVDPETVMQYTGLQDKNGKEIYEGDILEDCYSSNVYEVVWNGDCWHLLGLDGELYDNGDFYYGHDITWTDFNIIGNRTDHLHLLGGESK
jgi:uncharacterized phage protein (TIGR01671 family)